LSFGYRHALFEFLYPTIDGATRNINRFLNKRDTTTAKCPDFGCGKQSPPLFIQNRPHIVASFWGRFNHFWSMFHTLVLNGPSHAVNPQNVPTVFFPEIRGKIDSLISSCRLRTAAEISESICRQHFCGVVTQAERIPGWRFAQYARAHDRGASDSAAVGSGQFSAR
jgi:hypothetical protein